MQTIELSADRQTALDALLEWRANDPGDYSQYVSVGGYAGTGKTTLIARLVEQWPGVAVAALCGKAANVLRSKGIAEAQTVHSLIYRTRVFGGRFRFEQRQQLEGVRTILIDESSMINDRLFHDLLSFGLPTVFFGDHDPEGWDIADSFSKSMRDDFGVQEVAPVKVGQKPEQVRLLGLPSNTDAKTKSSRFKKTGVCRTCSSSTARPSP
jgi:hypothetical protein